MVKLRILCNSDLRLYGAAAVTKPTRKFYSGCESDSGQCQEGGCLLAFLVEMVRSRRARRATLVM